MGSHISGRRRVGRHSGRYSVITMESTLDIAVGDTVFITVERYIGHYGWEIQ